MLGSWFWGRSLNLRQPPTTAANNLFEFSLSMQDVPGSLETSVSLVKLSSILAFGIKQRSHVTRVLKSRRLKTDNHATVFTYCGVVALVESGLYPRHMVPPPAKMDGLPTHEQEREPIRSVRNLVSYASPHYRPQYVHMVVSCPAIVIKNIELFLTGSRRCQVNF